MPSGANRRGAANPSACDARARAQNRGQRDDAAGIVLKEGARLARHGPIQPEPVPARGQPVERVVRRAGVSFNVVRASPHRQNVPDALARAPCVASQFIAPVGKEIDDGLVHTVDGALLDRNADQRRGHALRDGLQCVRGVRRTAVEVLFEDELPVAYDQHAVDVTVTTGSDIGDEARQPNAVEAMGGGRARHQLTHGRWLQRAAATGRGQQGRRVQHGAARVHVDLRVRRANGQQLYTTPPWGAYCARSRG